MRLKPLTLALIGGLVICSLLGCKKGRNHRHPPNTGVPHGPETTNPAPIFDRSSKIPISPSLAAALQEFQRQSDIVAQVDRKLYEKIIQVLDNENLIKAQKKEIELRRFEGRDLRWTEQDLIDQLQRASSMAERYRRGLSPPY